jgi:hypothetical protein
MVTGLAAAFQTLTPRPIQLGPKNAYQNKQKDLSTCAGSSFEERRSNFSITIGDDQSDYQDDWRRSPP